MVTHILGTGFHLVASCYEVTWSTSCGKIMHISIVAHKNAKDSIILWLCDIFDNVPLVVNFFWLSAIMAFILVQSKKANSFYMRSAKLITSYKENH
jgi:hypothetical protein